MIKPVPTLRVLALTVFAVVAGRIMSPFAMWPRGHSPEASTWQGDEPAMAPTAPPMLVPVARPGAAARPVQTYRCFDPKLARGAELVVLGAYEGGATTSLSFGRANRVGRVSVQANASGKPLLLILSAYESVVWDFRGFPLHRLRGVLLSGYYDQVVTGLPPSVPVLKTILDHESGISSPRACVDPFYVHEGGEELDEAQASIRASFGRDIDRFAGAYRPAALQADNGLLRAYAPSQGERLAGLMSQFGGLVAPERAIEMLIARGDLRPARQADVTAWNQAATNRLSTGRLAPFRSEVLTANALVVLRPIMIPRGMYGAHSREFIVPPNVPMPSDPGSHNSYFLVGDGSCRGASFSSGHC